MKRYTGQVLNPTTGLPIQSAGVSVFVTGTTTKPPLYASNDSTSAPIANPIVTDRFGEYAFFAPDGIYDFVEAWGSSTNTITGVEIFDLTTINARLGGLDTSVALTAAQATAAVGAAGTAGTAAANAEAAAISTSSDRAAIVALGSVGGSRMYETWAALSSVVGAANDGALVLDSDTGTHNDQVTNGPVNNGGLYRFVGGGGWKRIGDTAFTLYAPTFSRAVGSAAAVAVDNRRNKVLLGNLTPGLIDPAGNPHFANDWRTFTISVTPGGSITTNLLFANNSGIKFLRGDGSVVQVLVGTGANGSGTPAPNGVQIAVPQDAVMMQASALLYRFISDGSNDQVLFPHLVLLEGTVALPGLFSDALLYEPVARAEFSRWIGRKVAADGDSYWSGRLWYSQLQADLGCQLTNFSQGGRTMANALKDANGNPLTAANVAGVDAFILSLHTNSAAAGLPVGTYNDASATFDANGNITNGANTYFAQAKGVIETLAGWNPSMMIMLGTPIYRVGVPLINDYYPAIRTLADMYGCALCEPHRKCGVNAATEGTLLVDHVHLTEAVFSSRYRSAWHDAFQRTSPVT